jgi:zinc transporter ZupT
VTTLVLAAAASLLTLLGGWLALRLGKHLQTITAFACGVLVAVALLDLLPEAFRLDTGPEVGHIALLTDCAIGFLVLYLADLLVPEQHAHGHEHHHHAPAQPRAMGTIGATLICMHSAVDGWMMGTLGSNAGVLRGLGLAVIFHRFADGVSTVSMMLRNGQSTRATWGFIALVAAGPLIGLGAWHLYPNAVPLPGALAVFAGAFLYAGGSHLQIREHGQDVRYAPLVTALGFALVYFLSP